MSTTVSSPLHSHVSGHVSGHMSGHVSGHGIGVYAWCALISGFCFIDSGTFSQFQSLETSVFVCYCIIMSLCNSVSSNRVVFHSLGSSISTE